MPKFLSLREQESFYQRNLHAQGLRYLIAGVENIEPRKNHSADCKVEALSRGRSQIEARYRGTLGGLQS